MRAETLSDFLFLTRVSGAWHIAAVVQSLSRVGLCFPMDCSTPGFSVLHRLQEYIVDGQ